MLRRSSSCSRGAPRGEPIKSARVEAGLYRAEIAALEKQLVAPSAEPPSSSAREEKAREAIEMALVQEELDARARFKEAALKHQMAETTVKEREVEVTSLCRRDRSKSLREQPAVQSALIARSAQPIPPAAPTIVEPPSPEIYYAVPYPTAPSASAMSRKLGRW